MTELITIFKTATGWHWQHPSNDEYAVKKSLAR